MVFANGVWFDSHNAISDGVIKVCIKIGSASGKPPVEPRRSVDVASFLKNFKYGFPI